MIYELKPKKTAQNSSSAAQILGRFQILRSVRQNAGMSPSIIYDSHSQSQSLENGDSFCSRGSSFHGLDSAIGMMKGS